MVRRHSMTGTNSNKEHHRRLIWKISKDAVRLFIDKDSVARYKYDRLRALGTPIARVSVVHSGTGARDNAAIDR